MLNENTTQILMPGQAHAARQCGPCERSSASPSGRLRSAPDALPATWAVSSGGSVDSPRACIGPWSTVLATALSEGPSRR